ncbi:MAG: GrdX family protein [Halanaerobiales bacterium]|nr:GrdX family protein [Halanaerobiales bacterium]
MKKYIMITNNPKVIKKYKDKEISIFSLNKIDKIFTTTRDLIHKGYILVTHPLAGSIKPYQNPYRSIILKEGEELDYNSLKNFENSFKKYKQFEHNKSKINNLSQKILDDYQVIDLSLIESALQSIKKG